MIIDLEIKERRFLKASFYVLAETPWRGNGESWTEEKITKRAQSGLLGCQRQIQITILTGKNAPDFSFPFRPVISALHAL